MPRFFIAYNHTKKWVKERAKLPRMQVFAEIYEKCG
jgi:hypothetical protein